MMECFLYWEYVITAALELDKSQSKMALGGANFSVWIFVCSWGQLVPALHSKSYFYFVLDSVCATSSMLLRFVSVRVWKGRLDLPLFHTSDFLSAFPPIVNWDLSIYVCFNLE